MNVYNPKPFLLYITYNASFHPAVRINMEHLYSGTYLMILQIVLYENNCANIEKLNMSP